MIRDLRTAAWWYWLATEAFLVASLGGWTAGVVLAVLVITVSAAHVLVRRRAQASLAVQARVLFALALVLGLAPPMHFLHWMQAIALTARLLFSYCLAARLVSLLPWNRLEPLSWRLMWRTFATPPTRELGR